MHGFLGPNGAGKSTTIRALLGLLRTDGGTATVFGLDPWRDAVAIHRRLAYVPGDVALWPNLVRRRDHRHAAADARRRPAAESRRAELLERFELDPTKRGRAYSKGNRQKVALVAAFAADVDLLVLDEPTSGLDPLMEQVFNECVAEQTAAGTTVLLSSHILSEVERLADRVTIIREGRAVETGTLARAAPPAAQPGRAPRWPVPVPDLSGIAGVHDVTVDGHDGHLLGRPRGDGRRARCADRRRRPGADQRAADAGGAVPRRLPDATAGPAMTTARDERLRPGTGLLVRHGRCAATGCWSASGWRAAAASSTPRRPRPASALPDRRPTG